MLRNHGYQSDFMGDLWDHMGVNGISVAFGGIFEGSLEVKLLIMGRRGSSGESSQKRDGSEENETEESQRQKRKIQQKEDQGA